MPLEHVEVNSPDGILPGFLIQAATKNPAPVVIFYSGFDVVKEMLYCFVREEFAHRGIYYRWMRELTPGLEFYGSVGNINNTEPIKEQQHYIFQ